MADRIALDFDGVLYDRLGPWVGVSDVRDAPVPGAIEFLLELVLDGLQPAIYSSRSRSLRGRRAMKRWLRHWGTTRYIAAASRHIPDRRLIPDGATRDRYFSKGVNERVIEGFEAAGMTPCEIGDDFYRDYRCAERAGKALVRACAWPWFKPSGVITLDSHAMTFRGSFPTPHELRSFRPWNSHA